MCIIQLMNGSSIWAIAILLVASVVTFITLITEKKEEERPTGLRKWRKTIENAQPVSLSHWFRGVSVYQVNNLASVYECRRKQNGVLSSSVIGDLHKSLW